MLKFNNITKVFDTDIFTKSFTALEKVSFEVEKNTVVGFLGANGAGKTSSLKIAMEFIPPSKGEVEYIGLGSTRKEIFSKVGYLPERPYFYPSLTGREFCLYVGSLCDVPSKILKEVILKWAPKFRIDFALDRQIRNYSKGMLQRLGFLSTIIHDPELIILDEPLSGVDPLGRKELKDIIVEIHQQGKTVFFSSHIISDVEDICEKVIFLKEGKLHYEGKVDMIINKNLKPFSTIRYMRNDQVESIEVKDSEKQATIKELIEHNVNIISVNQHKPTLEEIFYKTKNDDRY
ncbi:MAG: ABC transporter ATP-binding protein [Bacteriovoracaceae bacterium]